jgi:hypothetical protein
MALPTASHPPLQHHYLPRGDGPFPLERTTKAKEKATMKMIHLKDLYCNVQCLNWYYSTHVLELLNLQLAVLHFFCAIEGVWAGLWIIRLSPSLILHANNGQDPLPEPSEVSFRPLAFRPPPSEPKDTELFQLNHGWKANIKSIRNTQHATLITSALV